MTYQRLISWIYKASNVLVLVLAVRLYFFIDKSKTKTKTKTKKRLQFTNTETGPHKSHNYKVVERHDTSVKKPQLTNTAVKHHSS